MKLLESVAHLWSTTRFRAGELSSYAERLMVEETRKGVMTMSLVFLTLLLGSAAIYRQLELGRPYVYTALALSALCLHVFLSARAIRETRALHLLGMTLLIVSGTAFVLLAHQTGAFGAALFMSVALLFMVIPMVPWGLREASIVTLLIYGVFSSSTWSVSHRFDAQTLLTLQAFMLAAGMVSLTLVARGASVRKEDIQSRFDLENAHREMERLSLQDPLTRAWNRRFLEAEFDGFVERARKTHDSLHFAIMDVDRFKALNDTHGHAYGDLVLQAFGRAFAAHLGDAGHLVRTGGDEFVLLASLEEPESLIEAALASVRASLAASQPGSASEVGISVGLVEVPPEVPVRLEDAYLVADGALYRAKRARPQDGPASLQLVRVPLGNGDAARRPG